MFKKYAYEKISYIVFRREIFVDSSNSDVIYFCFG